MTDTPIQDLRYLLAMPAGRRAIWHILGKTGLYRQPAVPGNTDLTFLNAGMLNVGLDIWADLLEANPEMVALMQKEAANAANLETTIAAERAGNGGSSSDGTRGSTEDGTYFGVNDGADYGGLFG